MLKPKAPNVIAHWSLLVEDFTTSALSFYSSVEAAVRSREVPDVEFSRVLWKEGGIASAEREYLRVQRGRLAFDICAAPFGRGYFFSSWLSQPRPKHSWLWFVVLGFACLVWFVVLFSLATSALSRRLIIGESGSAGCLFGLLLFGIPATLLALGWAVREGHMNVSEEEVLAIPVLGWLYLVVFNPNTYYRLDTAAMFQKSVHNAVTEVIDALRTEKGLRALAPDERTATIRDFMR